MKPWPALCLASCIAIAPGCRKESRAPADIAPAPAVASADRLAPSERLPEAETAFGLPIPQGMRLTRHFGDSAYFGGKLGFESALDHVRKHVAASRVEMMGQRAVFPRAQIQADTRRRLFRIEVSKTPSGSQVYVKDVTPPPATVGLSEAELWKRAGRKPDGSLLDPNSVY